MEAGSFVGRFGDQEYELGTTEAGSARAIRLMSAVRREILAEEASGSDVRLDGVIPLGIPPGLLQPRTPAP